ncbi:MAG: Ig-like domain-containing protein [Reichenbachiella sp.]
MKTSYFFGHLFFILFIFLGCSQEIGIAHDTDSREERAAQFVAGSDAKIDRIDAELIMIRDRILALPEHSSSIAGAKILLQQTLDELLLLEMQILESEEYVNTMSDSIIISENSAKIDSIYTFYTIFLEPPPISSSVVLPSQQSSVNEVSPSSTQSSSEIGESSVSSSSMLSSEIAQSSSSREVINLDDSSENSAPVFMPILAQLSDTTLKGAELMIPLSATDAQDDEISWSIKSDANAMNGTVTIPEGAESFKNILYTPNNDFFGTDSFVVEISDILSATSELKVFVVVEDVPDYYLNFDGDDDYVALSDIDIDLTNGLTIEFWAKLNESADYVRLIEFGNGEADDNIFLCIKNDSHEDLYFRIYDEDAGGDKVYANGILSGMKEDWVHIAMTMASTGDVLFYKNGKIHTDITGSNATIPNIVTRTKNFVGQSSWGGTPLLNGSMDEVRIWSTVRTQAEIEDNVHSQLTGAETGLMHLWGFDEGSGMELLDKVTSLNSGSLENMAASAWSQYL